MLDHLIFDGFQDKYYGQRFHTEASSLHIWLGKRLSCMDLSITMTMNEKFGFGVLGYLQMTMTHQRGNDEQVEDT